MKSSRCSGVFVAWCMGTGVGSEGGQNSLHRLCRFLDMLACSQMLKNISPFEVKQWYWIVSGS